MPQSSLITKVLADIQELEKTLAAAERRWKLYNERASKLAAVSVTGMLGAAPRGGGGGASSATAQQKSDLKRQEEEHKSSLRRQFAELEAAIKRRNAAVETGLKRDLESLKTANSRELETVKNQGKLAVDAQKDRFKREGELRKQAVKQAEQIEKDANSARKKADSDAQKEAERIAKEGFALRETQRLFREKREREASLKSIQDRKDAERKANRDRREADRQARQQERADAAGRREQGSLLRGNLRELGVTPDFRSLGSSPQTIARLTSQLREANTAGERFSRTVRRIADKDLRDAEQRARFFSNAIGLIAGTAIVGGFAKLIKSGIELNRQYELFSFNLTTSLAQTSKVVDAQGNLVQGARAFAVLNRDAQGFFKDIRKEAAETILDVNELTQVVTENFAQATAAGIPESQVIDVASKIAQLAKASGLQGGTQQLSQEFRAILEGENLRNATVAKRLGLTTEAIKQAKEEGRLAEFLLEKFISMKDSVDAFQQSSNVAFSTLASKGQDFLRLSLEDVFKRITGRVLDFNKVLTDDRIAAAAKRFGAVITNLFRPIERFIESGQAARLGEAFEKGFLALQRVQESGAFNAAIKLFELLIANADKLVKLFAVIGLFRLGAGLGTAGVKAFETLAPAATVAGSGLGGAAAGVGGGALGGALARGGLRGAASRGLATFGALGLRGTLAAAPSVLGPALASAGAAAGALALPPALIGAVAGGLTLAPFAAAERSGLALESQRAAIQREPGERNTGARLGIARQALQDVQRQIREATGRGERVTTQTKFPVALGGDSERTIQLSFEQAQRRVQIAEQAEEKLRRIAKAGGDRRVEIVKEKEAQILDLERLGTQQRIAQLEGDVKRQIELETVLNVAQAQIGENRIKNEKDRAAFILAARNEGGRKLRELEQKADLDTRRAESEASGNRVRGRRIDAETSLGDINESVRTGVISREQGLRQRAALIIKERRENLEDFRNTQDRAIAIQDDFQRATLRAVREQREAKQSLVDFERQVAREQRSLIRERIDAERDLTEAIREQAERREDIQLSRDRRKLLGGAETALRGAGVLEDLTRTEAIRLEKLGLPFAESSDLARAGAEQQIRAAAEQAIGGDVTGALAGLEQRGARLKFSRFGLRQQLTALGLGAQNVDLRAEDIERLREVAEEDRALGEDARGVRGARERLGELGEREADLRQDAERTFQDLEERIQDSGIELADRFIEIAKEARALIPDLGQFGAALKPIANIINEIARLTPGGAAARAGALGPGAINVNATLDLAGALGAGSVLDPLLARLLDAALEEFQEDLRRGPVGRR